MRSRSELIPATPSERFARVFMWYTRRLLRRRFHRVCATPATLSLLGEIDRYEGPAVLCCTHSAWWDPLVALLFQRDFLGQRRHYSPIDADQLRRFGFFRKLGLFGIDPDDPASLRAMTDYLQDLAATVPKLTLGITPQGRFADPREPIRIRPGAAAIAASMPNVRMIAAGVEYVFWQDARPSVFVHAAEVHAPPVKSTAAWHRAAQQGLQAAADTLAGLVIARNPEAFTVILGPPAGTASDVNPAHGLWLRLRGRKGEIAAHRPSPRPAVEGGPL